MRAHEVEISPGALLHPLLPGSHFAHAARISLARRPDSAVQAYLDIARQVPAWFDGLMRMRNAGMRRLGIFTLQALRADGVVLGDSDRHLRVDLSLELQPADEGCDLQLSTVVHLHRPFGRLYMLPVAPLHRRIVPRLLETYARRLSAPAHG